MIITDDSKDSKAQPIETLAAASSSTQSYPVIATGSNEKALPLAPPAQPEQEPPPYERTQASSSTSPIQPDPEASRFPRVNYLYVCETTTDIRGWWRVDPNLRIPSSLLPTVPDGAKRDNLHLTTRTGSIYASCMLVPSEPVTIKSFLHAETQTGKVKMDFAPRRNHRFYLSAKSTTGNITVRIPRDFHGPVAFKLQTGKIHFSPAVHSIFMPLNHVGNVGRGFIGNWDDSAYPDLVDVGDSKDVWPGDEMVLETQTGNIKVFYCDEPIPPREKDLILSDLRERGPIAALGMSVKRSITKAMGSGSSPSSGPKTYRN